jgi:hypothetical protein
VVEVSAGDDKVGICGVVIATSGTAVDVSVIAVVGEIVVIAFGDVDGVGAKFTVVTVGILVEASADGEKPAGSSIGNPTSGTAVDVSILSVVGKIVVIAFGDVGVNGTNGAAAKLTVVTVGILVEVSADDDKVGICGVVFATSGTAVDVSIIAVVGEIVVIAFGDVDGVGAKFIVVTVGLLVEASADGEKLAGCSVGTATSGTAVDVSILSVVGEIVVIAFGDVGVNGTNGAAAKLTVVTVGILVEVSADDDKVGICGVVIATSGTVVDVSIVAVVGEIVVIAVGDIDGVGAKFTVVTVGILVEASADGEKLVGCSVGTATNGTAVDVSIVSVVGEIVVIAFGDVDDVGVNGTNCAATKLTVATVGILVEVSSDNDKFATCGGVISTSTSVDGAPAKLTVVTAGTVGILVEASADGEKFAGCGIVTATSGTAVDVSIIVAVGKIVVTVFRDVDDVDANGINGSGAAVSILVEVSADDEKLAG